MATLMRVFRDEAAAERAAEALMAAGVPGDRLHIMNAPVASAGEERVGTFDDENALTEREGTFDDADAQRRREGTFADTGGNVHDARVEPHGSFAEGQFTGPRHSQATDHAHLLRTATEAGISGDMANRELANLPHGSVVLLVDVGASDAAQVEALLR